LGARRLSMPACALDVPRRTNAQRVRTALPRLWSIRFTNRTTMVTWTFVLAAKKPAFVRIHGVLGTLPAITKGDRKPNVLQYRRLRCDIASAAKRLLTESAPCGGKQQANRLSGRTLEAQSMAMSLSLGRAFLQKWPLSNYRFRGLPRTICAENILGPSDPGMRFDCKQRIKHPATHP